MRAVVGFLVAAVGVEFFHRQIMAVAIEPLRVELGFSYTQAGALVFAFGAGYAIFALVLGRLADSGSRRNVYVAGIAIWSAATALGAACGGFATLCATRFLVGAAQGASGACNGPLLADYVRPEKRAGALGLLSVGGALGAIGAMTAGGYATEAFGWRGAFLGSGVVGVLFALTFVAVVAEPPRGWSEGRPPPAAGQRPAFAEVWRVCAQPGVRNTIIAGVLANTALLATAQWAPAFFMSVHKLTLADAGVAGGVSGLFAVIGGVAGGLIADRAWVRDARAVLRIPAVGLAAGGPIAAAAYLWPTSFGAIGLLVVATSFGMLHAAPLGAVMQALAPLRMRAVVTGFFNAVITLVAQGCGPLLTGWLSDRFELRAPGRGLAWALSLTALLYLWAAVHLFLASRHLVEELELARAAD